MPSFLSTDNWLVRRVAAALFGWERNHQIDGSALAYEVNDLYTNDRHFFTGFPDKWVVKKPSGCGGSYGDLRLTVTETYKVYNTDSLYASDPAFYDSIGSLPWYILAFEPECYSGGDGHLYDNWDIYTNVDNGTGYDVNKSTRPLGGTPTSTSLGTSATPITGGGYAYPNTITGYLNYGAITGSKVTPSQLLSNTYGGVSTTVTNYELRLREPSTSSYAHASDVVKTNIPPSSTYTYDVFGRLAAPYVSTYTNFATTLLWDDDWTATGCVEKTTCELRWKYDPRSSQGCKWWAGVQVQLKVTYKKAAMTKTDGPDGVFFSLGSFGAAGDWTTTVTLQDTYTDDFVSTAHTMPSEEGYIYAIDDIEVLSVTHP